MRKLNISPREDALGTIYARSSACWAWLADGALDGVPRPPMRAE